jgi:hypothetical protein
MPAFATKPPEPGDQRQDFLKHPARHRDLGHLKGRVAAVAHSVPRRSRSAVWFSALVLPLGHIFGRPVFATRSVAASVADRVAELAAEKLCKITAVAVLRFQGGERGAPTQPDCEATSVNSMPLI